MAEAGSAAAKASKYEGVKPWVANLHRAHRALGYAYLIWFGLFVLGIVVYHSSGKPGWLIDGVVPVLMGIFIAIWLASQLCIFCSHVFVRRMYMATIPSFFLHGFMMLFPLLNAAVVWSMAPELSGGTARKGAPGATPPQPSA